MVKIESAGRLVHDEAVITLVAIRFMKILNNAVTSYGVKLSCLASICKGICVRHKAQGPASFGRYMRGQKRCQVCQIFLELNGVWCLCCGTKLRTRSRNWKCRSESKMKGTENIAAHNRQV